MKRQPDSETPTAGILSDVSATIIISFHIFTFPKYHFCHSTELTKTPSYCKRKSSTLHNLFDAEAFTYHTGSGEENFDFFLKIAGRTSNAVFSHDTNNATNVTAKEYSGMYFCTNFFSFPSPGRKEGVITLRT
jgi:hypothetical protein